MALRLTAFVLVSLLLSPGALAAPRHPQLGLGWNGSHLRVLKMLNTQEYRSAADGAQRLIRKNRRDYKAHYLLGRATVHLGAPKTALKHFSRAIKLKPDDPHSYFSRAIVLVNSNEYKAAVKDLEKAVELAPKEAIYWVELSRTYSRISESAMETATSLSPSRLRAKYRLGDRYWRAGAVMRARDVWGEIVAKVPQHWRAHLRLAQYYQGVADLKKATEHYNAVIEVKPQNTKVLEQLIQIHNQQGLHAHAEAFRARYLKYRRKEASARYAPSRNPNRRRPPRPRFVVDQFQAGNHDVITHEWLNRRKTDALYTFSLTIKGAGDGWLTLEMNPDQEGGLLLIRRDFTPAVATGLGGLNAKPPPPPPGRTIKTYVETPTYPDVKRDVIAALQGRH